MRRPAGLLLIVVGICFAIGQSTAAAAESPGVMVHEFIYDSAPFPSCHASTLEHTPAGIVAAWFGGTDEGEPDVGIWTSRRDSQTGKWSAPVEVANGIQSPEQRYPCWNPVLYQMPDGPLLLFYKVGPSPRKWWGMLITSADSGQSWSAPVRLPEGILGPIKDKPVLYQGTLLCPSSTEHDGWKAHMEWTADGGKTWAKSDSVADPQGFGVIQPTLLVHAGNKLQILCRSSRKRQIAQSWSSDGGNTWSALEGLSLPNPNSGIDAVNLRDGRMLVVYNHTTRGRSPLNVALSGDGQHWQAAAMLENEPGEYSYPAVICTPDGLAHITYTWKRKKLRYAVVDPGKLKPQDIVDGQWPQ